MKRLTLLPLLGGIVTLGGVVLNGGQAFSYYRLCAILAALMASVAAFTVSRSFLRGERLFACWTLMGIAYALATCRYTLREIGVLEPQARAFTILLGLQSCTLAVALLLYVRLWSKTSLGRADSRLWRILPTAFGIVIAIMVGSYPLLRAIEKSRFDAVLLVSTIGAIIGTSLIVPLILPALAMRGGLLMHVWLYLAASEIFWLFYDVFYAIRSGGYTTSVLIGVEEATRVVALLFVVAAAVAQRRAVR